MSDVAAVRLRRGIEPTPMQRGFLASQLRHPTSPLQNMALLTHLDGAVDAERLAAAFATVVEASDALRSTFPSADGVPRVVVARDVAATEIVDLHRDEVAAWAARRAAVPIEIGRRAYDSVLVRHDDGTTSWFLSLHHAVTDATSSALVFDATARAYHGEAVQLPSYYAWAATVGRADDARRQRAAEHWRRREPSPRLPQLYRPVRRATPSARRVRVPVDADTWRSARHRLAHDLAMVSDDLAWTTLVVCLAALHVHKLTDADRFSIGLPVHNRVDVASRSVIGPAMEVYPVEVTIEPGDSLRSLHQRIGRSVMTTIRHARAGLAPASSDHDVVVNVIPRAGLGPFGDVSTSTEWIPTGAIDPGDLMRVQLTAYGHGQLDLVVDLNDAAADPVHHERAGTHLLQALRALVDDPDRAVADVGIADARERAAIEAWGRADAPDSNPPDVVERLASALDGADHVAVDDEGRSLTGDQHWRRVRAVAAWLRSRGIGTGVRVGVEMRRSADAVAAIHAVLVAGGSYVPIDPDQPPARTERLVRRAGCALVLRQLPSDDELARAESGSDAVRVHVPHPDDEAYLLFTSGSTGEPKGVPITRRGLAEYVRFAHDAYVDHDAPVAPLFSALTFDLTVTTLFVPLVAGGRVVVIRHDGAAGIARIAARDDLTWMKATPSHLELLRRSSPASSLRILVVGGEAFTRRLADAVRDVFPGVRVFNEYGPTEAVVGCMIHESVAGEHPGESDVPIGVPAPGVHLRIVDRALRPVPVGGVGELLISHASLTAGYLDRGPDDERFVIVDGERAYRSGDLVRLVDDRTAIYLGRTDEQVKVGGIRLEPSEVEQALSAHPAIARAAVRTWSPAPTPAERHCVRCGLPSNVPGTRFDADGVCDTCHAYDRVAPQARSWFKTPDDLAEERARARRERSGRYDCLHLLSGGKDSTYALYQLVEAGFEVYAMTLDNGFISEGAKENVRRSVADLGIDHEFATTEAMDAIFRDSLERHSNVCHGCYKTIYTLATNRAVELGIPLVVTGLSRGQLFETRLVPEQFSSDRFDPDAIDRAVIEARKAYHRVDDGTNRLLDTSVFADDELFERVRYLDFYRYVDVDLTEMLEFLGSRAPWVRPSDTGRSTNCLVNAAGIHAHVTEQGYHNYAVPYAWDVRLGHKRRDEAMAELDDELDLDEVGSMLERIGYEPHRREVLTAWFELADHASSPSPAELRTFLSARLPAHAVPAAFVEVDELPVTSNGKLDTSRLPEPTRVHRGSAALQVAPATELERHVVRVYERVLGIEPVGTTDDFFALGGDSLAALGMVVVLSEVLGRTVREELVFTNTTPRALASALEADGFGDCDDAEADDPRPDAPTRRAADEPPTISVRERAMLFEHAADPTDPRYHVAHQFTVHGPVDVDRLVDSLLGVVDAHVPLHWTYDEPRTRLAPTEAMLLDVELDHEVDDAEFDALAQRIHRRPFDLARGPLGRCLVRRLDGESPRLGVVVVFHHVSIDAGSFGRLWTELDLRYRDAPDAIPLPEFDFADHQAWQEARAAEADARYWRALASPTAHLDFGVTARDGTDISPDGFVERQASFNAAELRAGPGTTMFATELAAVAAVLRRYADGDRIGIGITASTRDLAATDTLIGYYLNTLPVYIDVGAGDTPVTVAERASTMVAGALAHRTYPLARIVADRRRDGLEPPDLSVLIAHEDWHMTRLGSAEVDHCVRSAGSAVADATFFVQAHGDRVHLGLEHRGERIDHDAAEILLREVDAAIRRIVDAPTAPLDASVWHATRTSTAAAPPLAVDPFARLGADDRSSIEREWSVARVPTTGPALLHERVLRHASASPDAVAVRAGTTSVTYEELDRRSRALATRLSGLGAGPGRRVGVLADRRIEPVIAIVAALRCGAAYVPIDPEYPPERVAAVVRGSGLDIVVVAGSGIDVAGLDHTAVRVVDLDADGGTDADAPPGAELPSPDVLDPDAPAYVIHTSGTTGRPKGVVVSHRNIVFSTAARAEVYDDAPAAFLLVSSFAFDSSMVGIFWTLTEGGTLVIPDPGRHDDVVHLAELVERHGVTHILSVPSLHEVLVTEAPRGSLRSLTTAIVAGEACRPRVVEAHRTNCPWATLTNEYGPTETTVWSHAFHVPPTWVGSSVPIGTAIPGVVGAVVDGEGRLVPVGSIGELLIGGPGVAVGYLDRPELDAERFVELPTAAGWPTARWYRTGDLVARRDDGVLEFRGRADRQVKIRGHRVELDEIERALEAVPGVRAGAVDLVAPGDDRYPGDPLADRVAAVLVAWWIPAERSDGASPMDDDPRADLRTSLPGHMVPTRWQLVDRLPLAPNGKVDLAQLPRPRPDAAGPSPAGVEPVGDLERAIADAWAQALAVPVEHVGRFDNFFDLGGDSIVSIQVVARLRRAGIELSPRDVFDHQTVGELAAVARTTSVAADRGPVVGDVAPLPIQHWFAGLGLTHPNHWAQGIWLDLVDDIDVEVLLDAWRHVAAHHDALRTTVRWSPDLRLTQAAEPVALEVVELHDDAPHRRHEVVSRLDPATGRLAAIGVLADGSRMFAAVHHLVIDGVSWGPLLEDWAAVYGQLADGRPLELPPRSTSVRAWSEVLANWCGTPSETADRAHWRSLPDPLTLPAIGPVTDSAELERDAHVVRVELDRTTTSSLVGGVNRAAERAGGFTVDELLLTAVSVAARATLGWPRLDLVMEGHGREVEISPDVDLSRTIGWFTSRIPVSLRPSGDDDRHDALDAIDALGRVASQLRNIPHHGIGHGVARHLGHDEVLEARPEPMIAYNYLGQVDRTVQVGHPFVASHGLAAVVHPDERRTHQLGILAAVRRGVLGIDVDHHPSRLAAADAQRLARGILDVIRELVDRMSNGETPKLTDDTAERRFELADLDADELDHLSALIDQLDG